MQIQRLTREEIGALYELPLPELIYRAATVHRETFSPGEIQLCSLLSIKTGACPEDCSYCPQSAHYKTAVEAEPLMNTLEILKAAEAAKAKGATRFCMGAAWRSVPEGPQFDRVLDAVRGVDSLGLEVCVTLGMLNAGQAERLKTAGVKAYNHNLDTSREFYPEIISTRTYDDRLETLQNVRRAGMTVCCGGIIGMGEARADRVGLLWELSHLDPQPESVPINLLVKAKGTPLAAKPALEPFELVRTIAIARILMPKSRVRLSAGRMEMSEETQALCILAGANSVFIGEELLTTPNPEMEKDRALFSRLGLEPSTIQA